MQLWIIFYLVQSLLCILGVLIIVALYTWMERKIMAAVQRRRGPNVVGFFGLLQPLADGLKALSKEIMRPRRANSFFFLVAPAIVFILSFWQWIFIPFSSAAYTSSNLSFFTSMTEDTDFGLLYVFAISTLNSYGIVLAGWASNAKYSLMGAIRTTAQMVSYEIVVSLAVIPVLLCSSSLHFLQIANVQEATTWFIFVMPFVAVMFYIAGLAETNRTPFDLPESESELVAGYMTEYSAIPFAVYFLAEYSNMLIVSFICALVFCGAWSGSILTGFPESIILFSKVLFFSIFFVFIRAILPRYKYSQLMLLGWLGLLPLMLSFVLFFIGYIIFKFSLSVSMSPIEVFFITPLYGALFVFLCGFVAVFFTYYRRTIIAFIMATEVMVLGVILYFIFAASNLPELNIYSLLLFSIAAAETTVGLGILVFVNSTSLMSSQFTAIAKATAVTP